jgi:hypothetical protein
LKYIPPSELTQDVLVDILLDDQQQFEFNYELELPKVIPDGVYIMKFTMIDPRILQKKNVQRDGAFGDPF